MIVLGIDPGSRRIGYGVIKVSGRTPTVLAAGTLEIRAADATGALREAQAKTRALIRRYRPHVFGIEKLYFAKNRKTAIAVAQTRGALVALAAQESLVVREYAPSEVKRGITGYGLADKQAVFKMVRAIFREPNLRVADDASDALAIAYMASREGDRGEREGSGARGTS